MFCMLPRQKVNGEGLTSKNALLEKPFWSYLIINYCLDNLDTLEKYSLIIWQLAVGKVKTTIKLNSFVLFYKVRSKAKAT